MRYYDSVPTRTAMLTSSLDSLRLISNEGLTMRKYTLSTNDDPGNFILSSGAGRYQIRINIGQFPTIPNTASSGDITNFTGAHNVTIGTYRPSIFGGSLITTAFRVRVTGSVGDTIRLGRGKLVFKKTSGGADTVITATAYKILISNNLNTVMKRLTSITIILSLPILVTSIYGMNVDIPYQHSNHAFYIPVVISLIVSLIISGYFMKKKWF
jgi:hypothetical protein